MTQRKNISSGAKWEDIAGYSRAVRVGNMIVVAGTVASGDDGEVIGEGDIAAQTTFILRKIEKALNDAGATLDHVVRTRMYVTDISLWEGAARAHGAIFDAIRPVTTLVEVSRLIDDRYLIEIEAEAILID